MIRSLLKLAAAGTDISSHAMTLHALAAFKSGPAQIIVELGVRDGNSTTALVAGCVEKCGRLVSYDTDYDRSWATRLRPDWTDAMRGRWEFRHRDSVEAAGDWPGAYGGWDAPQRDIEHPCVHMLVLDTSHLYDQTARELNTWMPKLHPAAVIAGHDYLLESGGVKKAVDEVAFAYSDRFELIVLPHDNGMAVLWPKAVP